MSVTGSFLAHLDTRYVLDYCFRVKTADLKNSATNEREETFCRIQQQHQVPSLLAPRGRGLFSLPRRKERSAAKFALANRAKKEFLYMVGRAYITRPDDSQFSAACLSRPAVVPFLQPLLARARSYVLRMRGRGRMWRCISPPAFSRLIESSLSSFCASAPATLFHNRAARSLP